MTTELVYGYRIGEDGKRVIDPSVFQVRNCDHAGPPWLGVIRRIEPLGKWLARSTVHSTPLELGYFDRTEDAHLAVVLDAANGARKTDHGKRASRRYA